MLYMAARDFSANQEVHFLFIYNNLPLNTDDLRLLFSPFKKKKNLNLFCLNSTLSEPRFKQTPSLDSLWTGTFLLYPCRLEGHHLFALNWTLPTFECCTLMSPTVIGAKWMEFIFISSKLMLSRCLVPVKVIKSCLQKNDGGVCWRFTSVLLRFHFFTCMTRSRQQKQTYLIVFKLEPDAPVFRCCQSLYCGEECGWEKWPLVEQWFSSRLLVF